MVKEWLRRHIQRFPASIIPASLRKLDMLARAHAMIDLRAPPRNRIPTHPGKILLEEFLIPFELSQVTFARHIGVPVQRVNEIVRGKRGVTPDTACHLQ